MAEPLIEFSAEALVPASHPALPGHFPGRPLVPAVVLLDCASRALRQHLGSLRISKVQGAKFLLPVLPDQIIGMHFAVDPATARARFRLCVDNRLAAQGELGFTRV